MRHVRISIIWLVLFPAGLFPQPAHSDAANAPPDGGSFAQMIESLNYKNTDIKDFIRMLATQYNINVLVDDDVNRRLTIHLVNVKVADVLAFIVDEYGLSIKQYGEIYKISNAPEPVQPPVEWAVFYRDGLLSVDFENDDLNEALRQVSEASGQTILLDRGAGGKISGVIRELPFEGALAQLLRTNGYRLGREGGALIVRRDATGQGAGNKSAGNIWIEIHDGLITVEVNNAPLSAVLDELSRQTGSGFFIMGEQKRPLSARANGLSLEACLGLVLFNSDLTFRKSGSNYLVGEKSDRTMHASRLFTLQHLMVDTIHEKLGPELKDGIEVTIIKEHNAILVKAPEDKLQNLAEIIKQIDQPVPQVFFEVLVVDYTWFKEKEFAVAAGLGGGSNEDSSRGAADLWIPGLDLLWNGSTANTYLEKIDHRFSGFNIGQLPADFYLKVKALESVGKANIELKPQLATLNGHEATLSIGETRYFKLVRETPLRDPSQVYISTSERFETVEINISLKITPWVSSSGEITVNIIPEFDTPGEQVSPEVPPNIQSRKLESTIRLRDGETIVLGGLIQEVESENRSRVPILGSIPLLGRLFSNSSTSRSKNELIIYVTPHLSYSDEWMGKG